jgi:seryl-tRNA synthetase
MMTHEQRLDRLERIARLMVRAGLRARREMRQQDDKITIMIDAQIKNEDRFADLAASRNQHDDKITIMIDAQIKNEALFAELANSQKQLAESQKNTDRRLDALIDIVKEGRNGKSR